MSELRMWPFSVTRDEVNRPQDVRAAAKHLEITIDVECTPTLRTRHIPDNYVLGAKALPLTNIDRDIERKLAPGIAGKEHIPPSRRTVTHVRPDV